MKYTVMQDYRCPLTGLMRSCRLNMVAYRNLSNAKRRADVAERGYVTPLGSSEVIYVGAGYLRRGGCAR